MYAAKHLPSASDRVGRDRRYNAMGLAERDAPKDLRHDLLDNLGE